MNRGSKITFVLFGAVALTACGGGGSGGSDSGTAVSASESSAGSSSSTGSTTTLSGCEVETYQADLLELVNAARSEARMCGDTHYAAAAPLTYSCTLEEAAQAHSSDMATYNFFSHTGSDGLSVGARVTATGYPWSIVGENIAAGYSSPSAVMAGWLDSPGHCANIMRDSFSEFGTARVAGDGTDYANYWTQVFAHPR